MLSSLSRWFRSPRRTVMNRAAGRQKTTRKPHLEPLEDRCLLSAGALDPTFGIGGIVNPPAFGVAGMAIQPADGKIVTAGTVYSGAFTADDFAVARYNANGSLDSTFGTGGKVVTDFGKDQAWDDAFATVLQPDGKILVAGRHSPKFNSGGNWDMALVRYNANGSLDKTFGGTGIVTTSFSRTSQEQATAVALQSDGKIVIAGFVQDTTSDFALARFNTNGTLDTAYGTGGRARIGIASGSVYARVHLVRQPDDKMVVEGDVYFAGPPESYQFAVARVKINGTLDTSFGGGTGKVVAALGESNTNAYGVALQGDGKIVVAGLSWNLSNGTGVDFALARFNSTGTLDTTFDGDGVRTVDLGITQDHNEGATSLAIQADGKIIAAGFTNGVGSPSSASDFAMIRVNPLDGSLDSTFGNGGIVITAVTAGQDAANAVVLQSDGKIVLGGSALARYLPAAPVIGSFTAGPNPVTAGSSMTLTVNITDANPGSTITQVSFYVDGNNNGVLDAGDTLLTGTSTYSSGTWTLTFATTGWALGSYKLFAQAQDSYGVLGDLLALTFEVA